MHRKREWLQPLFILAVSALLAAPFLGKALHIDDPVYVLEGAHLAANPTRPLDLEIFWFQWPERLADSNPVTPPAWPLQLAGWIALAGEGQEVWWNAWAALHGALLGLGVYALGRGRLRHPLLPALLVASSPAVLVGRNLMLDIPMASYLVGGLALADAGIARGRRDWIAAGALGIGLASVTKLPGILGAPGLVAALWFRERRVAGGGVEETDTAEPGRRLDLSAAALVLAPLALWYGYQLFATGGIDLLRPRGGGGFEPQRSLVGSLRIALDHGVFWGGAIFSGCAYLAAWAASRTRLWPLAAAPLFILLGGAFAADGLTDPYVAYAMPAAFWVGGIALAIGALRGARRLTRAGPHARRLALLLGPWVLCQLAFDVVGLWEMSIRFAFLSALPATLLCCVEIEALAAGPVARRSLSAAFSATLLGAALSCVVAWEDMQWAEGYRRIAGELAERHATERVWFTGHWGLQHYAIEAGLRPYVPRDHSLRAGDLLAIPDRVAKQKIPRAVWRRLSEIESHEIEVTSRVRTMGSGGAFYSTGWGSMPWGAATGPADEIRVYRVRQDIAPVRKKRRTRGPGPTRRSRSRRDS